MLLAVAAAASSCVGEGQQARGDRGDGDGGELLWRLAAAAINGITGHCSGAETEVAKPRAMEVALLWCGDGRREDERAGRAGAAAASRATSGGKGAVAGSRARGLLAERRCCSDGLARGG